MTGSPHPELTNLPRRLLDSLGEGVSIAGADGTIVYSNQAADRILGVPRTELPSKEWADHYGMFLPDGRTRFPADQWPLIRALRGEATNEIEMVVRNRTHPWDVRIAVTGRPMRDESGEIVGATVVFRDVTDLSGAQAALARANDELRRVQALKDDLSAFVMHDLNGPLTGILALSELMIVSGDGLSEEALESLMELKGLADALHRMVVDLLDLKVSEDGALRPEREVVSVDDMLLQVCRVAGPRASLAGKRVQSVGSEAGLCVCADHDFLFRTLQNLVDNGIKYAPAGSAITVSARPGTPNTVRFEVWDEGPGVPPELQEAIFDKYARLERDHRMGPRQSRGLGLRFCRIAVEAQRGRIWVENAEPRGARFCIELPVPR